jgi:hypothetical protein
MSDSPEKTSSPTPEKTLDLSDLPSPPDLSKRNDSSSEQEGEKGTSKPIYPTTYPLSPQALAERVQSWVKNPQDPFDRLNRLPQVDLPPENIAYQSPFLFYKGATLKPPM